MQIKKAREKSIIIIIISCWAHHYKEMVHKIFNLTYVPPCLMLHICGTGVNKKVGSLSESCIELVREYPRGFMASLYAFVLLAVSI